MKLLKFLGHSDDIFEYGVGNRAIGGDEAYAIQGDAYPISRVHAFLLKDSKGEGFYVCAMYAPKAISSACWVVGIAPLDENIPLPHWDISYEAGLQGYHTPVLIVSAPDDVDVTPIAPPHDS